MKLIDFVILEEKIERDLGFWHLHEDYSNPRAPMTRTWTPVFRKATTEDMYPKGQGRYRIGFAQVKKGNPIIDGIPGFMMDNPQYSKMTNAEKDKHKGLLNALKQRRSEEVASVDVINDFGNLLEKCGTAVLEKAKMKTTDISKVYMICPYSSSPVTKMFAQHMQKRMGVPDNHTFWDSLEKKDIDQIIKEIQSSDAHVKTKEMSTLAVQRRGQIKDLRKGHRSELVNKGVNFLDIKDDIQVDPQDIEDLCLIVVDDSVTSLSTGKMATDVFIKYTGTKPLERLLFAMFRYK